LLPVLLAVLLLAFDSVTDFLTTDFLAADLTADFLAIDLRRADEERDVIWFEPVYAVST
jgi:hypothetical protein